MCSCGYCCNLKTRCTTGGSAGVCASPSDAITTNCESWELVIHQHYHPTVNHTAKSWSRCKLFSCDWTSTLVARSMNSNRLLSSKNLSYSYLILEWFEKFYFHCHQSRLQNYDRMSSAWSFAGILLLNIIHSTTKICICQMTDGQDDLKQLWGTQFIEQANLRGCQNPTRICY